MIDDIQAKTKELQGIASKQNMLALNASIEERKANQNIRATPNGKSL